MFQNKKCLIYFNINLPIEMSVKKKKTTGISVSRCLFLSLSIMLATFVDAQSIEWLTSFGAANDQVAYSTNVDNSGNVYTTGIFFSSINFETPTGNLTLNSAGGLDIFISKMDSDGNLIWALSFGGSLDEKAYSYVDSSGNIFTIGYFNGTVDFDPGSGTNFLSSAGDKDIFIQKLNSDGNFIWAKSIGGPSGDIGQSICVDPEGNILTTGIFSGTVDFNPGTGINNFASIGSKGIFIQKLDSNGNYIWTKTFGGGSYDYGQKITVSPSGNIYTTGYFSGTVDFDPSPGISNSTAIGSNDVFIQKLESTGNFLWVKTFGGIHDDRGFSIALDDFENAYVIGFFQDIVDFDPGSGTAYMASQGSIDVFVLKLKFNGTYDWVKTFAGPGSDFGFSINIDDLGNIYTTGAFYYTISFETLNGPTTLTSAGNLDVYVNKMDVTGNTIWVKQFGSIYEDYGFALHVDENHNIYSAGSFTGVADFNPGSNDAYLTSQGNIDAFIVKLIPELVNIDSSINPRASVYPNPTSGLIYIENPNSTNMEINILSTDGKLIQSISEAESYSSLDLSDFDNGIYLISIETNGVKQTKRVVKN